MTKIFIHKTSGATTLLSRHVGGSFVRVVCTFSLAAVFTACSSVSPDNATGFSSAAAAVSKQSSLTFASVNSVARQAEIDQVASQDHLSKKLFITPVPAADIARWENALTAMQAYGDLLAKLSSPAVGDSVSQATVDFQGKVQTIIKKPLDAGLATAFQTLANTIVRASAQHEADAIARKANPAIQHIVTLMAAAIGESSDQGLRGTAHANYEVMMTPLYDQFSASKEDRHKIAEQLANILDTEDQLDVSLAALRSSIIELGNLNQSMANKSPFDVQKAITAITEEVATAQSLHDKILKLNGSK